MRGASVLVIAVLASGGWVCNTGSAPTDAPPNGYQQCQMSFGPTAMYCNTNAGMQFLAYGVPGECCTQGAGATGIVGYLCIYNNSSSTGGVCQDMATISSGCGPAGTVVRCCNGSPC